MSERISEWHSTYVPIYGCSEPLSEKVVKKERKEKKKSEKEKGRKITEEKRGWR